MCRNRGIRKREIFWQNIYSCSSAEYIITTILIHCKYSALIPEISPSNVITGNHKKYSHTTITDYLESTIFWLILKVLDQSINKSQVVIHGGYSSFVYFSKLFTALLIISVTLRLSEKSSHFIRLTFWLWNNLK